MSQPRATDLIYISTYIHFLIISFVRSSFSYDAPLKVERARVTFEFSHNSNSSTTIPQHQNYVTNAKKQKKKANLNNQRPLYLLVQNKPFVNLEETNNRTDANQKQCNYCHKTSTSITWWDVLWKSMLGLGLAESKRCGLAMWSVSCFSLQSSPAGSRCYLFTGEKPRFFCSSFWLRAWWSEAGGRRPLGESTAAQPVTGFNIQLRVSCPTLHYTSQPMSWGSWTQAGWVLAKLDGSCIADNKYSATIRTPCEARTTVWSYDISVAIILDGS